MKENAINKGKSMPVNNSDKSAEFLISEYEAIQSRALGFEQNKSNRVNFLLIVVAALMASLGQIITNAALAAFTVEIALIVAFVVFLLGLLTLKQSVEDSVSIVIMHRRAGRIRLWFVEQNHSIAPYVAFQYGDDRPRVVDPLRAFLGGEPIILIINILAFCALVTILSSPSTWLYAISICLFSAVVFWFAQMLYLRYYFRKADKFIEAQVKFRYSEMHDRIEKAHKAT
jgi:hypothetical protein